MKILHVCFFGFLSVSLLFSQDINQAEVKVIEGFVPEIPESEKIKETTEFNDTTKIDKVQRYSFLNKTLDISYDSRPLKSAKLSGENLPELKRISLFLAGGTHSLHSKISYNSLRKDDYSYGLIFNQFSNKYKVYYDDDRGVDIFKNSIINLKAFGKKVGDKNIFVVNLDYDRRVSNTGTDFSDPSEHKNCYINRFSYSKLGVSIFSKELSDHKLKHKTKFFISDLNELSENQIHISSILSKHVYDSPFTLKLEFNDYINYSNTDSLSSLEKTNVKELLVSPSTLIQEYGFDFNVGIDLYYQQDLGDSTSFVFAPQLKISKHLVKNILYVEGGIRSVRLRNTIKLFSDENPFIRALGTNQKHEQNSDISLNLKSTDTRNELYLGMKNVLSKDEIFDGIISYAKISNMPFYYWIDLETNGRFYSSYVDVWRLRVNANYKWQINDLIGVNASINYFNYDTIVSNKENINGNFGVFLNLDEKIKLNTSISYLGERKSLTAIGDFETSMVEVNWLDEYILNPQLHANISINYNYTNSIAGYLRINNILNSKQEMWKGYREIGVNAWFGLSYLF
ncbi:MAG: hypothetical protein CMD02_06715 [Flavobacteriales bacterium]|nr:hypothetical protein [Flavobacteriales bacterium]